MSESKLIDSNQQINDINLSSIQHDIQQINNKSNTVDINSDTTNTTNTNNTANKQRNIIFNVTGFGEFAGVTHNPTATIINKLPDIIQQYNQHKQHNQDDYIILHSATVLPTDALNSARWLQHKSMTSDYNTNDIIVYIHCGVNKGSHTFNIELQAYNTANFGCADVSGYQPLQQCIDTNKQLEQPLYSKLDVKSIVDQLQQLRYSVQSSIDPGRCMLLAPFYVYMNCHILYVYGMTVY